jgi:uncharacterized protein YlxP (DUF503 family)
MHIGVLVIEIMVYSSNSLKEKRFVLRSLKDRLRNRFNVALCETDYQDKWQRAVLAVCLLGNDKRQLESDMSRVRQVCEEAQDLQIAAMHQQWL